MTRGLILGALLLLYALVVVPFTTYMRQRPVALKLGYTPAGEALRLVASDQRYLLAQLAVDRVLFYFGSLFTKDGHRVSTPPEYFNMFATMQSALKLDPYNMDAYYFTEAAFTWELKRIREVNNMLDYGMKYRTWDAQLPFYAGFNAAYFSKDYRTASLYMQKAAELSGNPLYTTLASRYFYEAGQSALGITFLRAMEQSAKDAKVKKIYQVRRKALEGITVISDALNRFREARHTLPPDLKTLVREGFLSRIPEDPYGGTFYLDSKGKVVSSSKLAGKQ
ncbi:hypothetical protein GMST_02780 [Geomonas silvestris]|uniref:Uncharacterized protein n=1 Tax=Geomonas silvestris TaxID=2740184 RepID=A0A6V8MDS1_9BACT|nr:hypothetical protein [Geomonas silvestris]GFO57953.1 hypothetical protein GMST_02780 [Geomonas silvestris]